MQSIMQQNESSELASSQSTLAYVPTAARIAIYDDFLSSPRLVDIPPAPTKNFIGSLSSAIYNEAKTLGGGISFTVIKQVTENFIHASFSEMVVSIFDNGNTIRFSDQGPGIVDKKSALLPGFSSATVEMKSYIDGVGSGLPIVKEYCEMKNGFIKIEDNLKTGSVITISLSEQSLTSSVSDSSKNAIDKCEKVVTVNSLLSQISQRSLSFLPLFLKEPIWGIQDLSKESNIPAGTMFNELKKLTELGIIKRVNKKYALTSLGEEFISLL